MQGRLILDGVSLELAKNDRGGWQWQHRSQAVIPGISEPESQQFTRAPLSHFRTSGWTDFSGGIGAAKQQPGQRRLHYSEGPTGAMPGRLVRGHEVRTTTFDNPGTVAVSDLFELNNGSTQQLYVVVGGTVRKVTLGTPWSGTDETIANRAGDGAGSGDNTGVYVSTLTFTVASPPWYDGTSTKVFLGTTDDADKMVSFNGNASWAVSAGAASGYWALHTSPSGQLLYGSSNTTSTDGVWVRTLAQGNNPATEASWSAKFPLGNRAAAITGIVALRENLIVTTADGQIYAQPYTELGGLYTLTDSKGPVPDTAAGLNMRVWGGVLFVPTTRGLFAYIEEAGSSRFESVGPEHLLGHEMPVRGVCTALFSGDPAGLWAAFYDAVADDSYVLRGRWPRGNEAEYCRFVWDTEGVGLVSGVKATALHLSHVGTNPVLCIGTDTPDVRFVTLPRQMRNILDDGNLESQIASRSTFLPDIDGGAPTTQKRFWQLRFKTIDFAANTEYAYVSVRVDRGNYNRVGTIQDTPIATINLPTGTEGASLGIEIDWRGTTALATYPQIEAVEIDHTSTPQPVEWVDCTIYVARNQHTVTGTSTLAPADVMTFIRRLQGQAREVEATGPDGATYTVKVDPGTEVVAVPVEDVPDKRGPGWVVSFRLNIYDQLREQSGFIWNQGYWTGGTRVSRWG